MTNGHRWQLAHPLRQGVESHIALQRTRHPVAHSAFVGLHHPFLATAKTSVEGGLEDDVLRAYLVEQSLPHNAVVVTDKFLVEGDGQRRIATKCGHLLPLVLPNGLLDAVDMVAAQLFQSARCFVHRKTTVGINAQFDSFGREASAQATDEVQFTLEINSPNLQFHTMEALTEFCLHSLHHLIVRPHPNEAVDGNSLRATRERRVVELEIMPRERGFGRAKGHFKTEEDGRVRAKGLRIEPSSLHHLATDTPQRCFVIAVVVATQIGERGTLSQSASYTPFSFIGEIEIPHLPLFVNTARSTRRLLKTKGARNDSDVHGSFVLGKVLGRVGPVRLVRPVRPVRPVRFLRPVGLVREP